MNIIGGAWSEFCTHVRTHGRVIDVDDVNMPLIVPGGRRDGGAAGRRGARWGTAHGGSAATMPPPQPHVSAYLKISIAQLILLSIGLLSHPTGRRKGGGGRERGGSIELVQTVSQVDQLWQRVVAAERSGA